MSVDSVWWWNVGIANRPRISPFGEGCEKTKQTATQQQPGVLALLNGFQTHSVTEKLRASISPSGWATLIKCLAGRVQQHSHKHPRIEALSEPSNAYEKSSSNADASTSWHDVPCSSSPKKIQTDTVSFQLETAFDNETHLAHWYNFWGFGVY